MKSSREREVRFQTVVQRLRRQWDTTPPDFPPGTVTFVRSNRACGDLVRIVLPEDGRNELDGLVIQSHGCSICTASAAVLETSIANRSRAEAREIVSAAIATIQTGCCFRAASLLEPESADDIDSFGVLSSHPVRSKCAMLAWEAAKELLLTDSD